MFQITITGTDTGTSMRYHIIKKEKMQGKSGYSALKHKSVGQQALDLFVSLNIHSDHGRIESS